MRDFASDNDANDGESYLEMAESNMDWSATAAIYVEESKVLPLANGFCGRIQLTLHAASTSLAFCHKATEDHHHRYYTLSKPLILNIELMYCYGNHHQNDDPANEKYDEYEHDPSTTMPSHVQLAWEYYPTELPELEKPVVLAWLTKKCQTKLQEEKELVTMCASFSIVELCEHELWSYWETIHQGYGYRLILLPPRMDLLYHSNIGSLLNPREEALKLERKKMAKRQQEDSEELRPINTKPNDALEYAKRALILSWKKLYVNECPICFDTIRCDKGVTLPCGHFFCEDCFPMYVQTKVSELAGYRTNPFLCPVEKCRAEISIEHIVRLHISTSEYKQVQRWQRDLTFPLCYSLDQCLSKACTEETTKLIKSQEHEPEDFCMRKRAKDTRNTFVFCDFCDKTWCELCLKRIKPGVSRQEHREVCESQVAIKFCRRYLRATEEQKRNCESKYPWIVTYAVSRQHDGEALQWILENGQICPNCSNGVERIEGCFHMKCSQCATHFCYECGKLFALAQKKMRRHHDCTFLLNTRVLSQL